MFLIQVTLVVLFELMVVGEAVETGCRHKWMETLERGRSELNG